MMRSRRRRAIGAALLCAAALGACGSGGKTPSTTTGAKPPHRDTHTVYVYSSLPRYGPQKAESQAIINGIKVFLANAESHQGAYPIKYISLNDASKRSGRWSATETVRNARRAAQNPHTIVYIGDLDSGATQLSLPILNQAGIVQITPGSGYPGLTNSVLGITQTDEPGRYYPNRTSHTLLRLIPNDLVEAAAALEKLKQTGCVHVGAAAFGGGNDARALVAAIAKTAILYQMDYVPPPKGAAPGNNTKLDPAYVEAMVHASVGCFVLAGRVTPAAVTLTKAIHAALPGGYIVGTNGFCNRNWLGAGPTAIPEAVDQFLYCTSPVLPLSKYPGAKPLIADLQKLAGKRLPASERYAVYGYQAAELIVEDAMSGLTDSEDNRKEVREALLGGGLRSSSVVGNFSFDPFGNIGSRKYGLYTFRDGKLVFSKTLNPSLVLQ
jgi:branched-chain amino acid transport system substrate-binding protein